MLCTKEMNDAWRRMKRGVGWGFVASMEMAILMGLASVLAISPMPTPFPLAIIRALLGASGCAPALEIHETRNE